MVEIPWLDVWSIAVIRWENSSMRIKLSFRHSPCHPVLCHWVSLLDLKHRHLSNRKYFIIAASSELIKSSLYFNYQRCQQYAHAVGLAVNLHRHGHVRGALVLYRSVWLVSNGTDRRTDHPISMSTSSLPWHTQSIHGAGCWQSPKKQTRVMKKDIYLELISVLYYNNTRCV